MKIGKGPDQHCHPLIRATAVEMAGDLYDLMMRNNEQWEEWKKLNPDCQSLSQYEIRFLELKWPELLEDARATLAGMLARPIDEGLKAEIHDALVKDNGLRMHRINRRASQVANRTRTLH